MFKTLPDAGAATVTVTINGKPFQAPQGCTAAAAVLLAGATPTRTTPVTRSAARAVLHDGRVLRMPDGNRRRAESAGVPRPVADGMRINRQLGAVTAKP